MDRTSGSSPAAATLVTDERDFRRALSTFPTGVAVVTACSAEGRVAGITINSFASVSLHPPLVLWSLAARAPSRAIFETASHFAIHILAEDQRPLADCFCSPATDKFAGLALAAGLGGSPLLDGASAQIECRGRHIYSGGDHIILIGEVERYSYSGRPPLVFYGGRYGAVAGPTKEPLYGETEFDAWQAFYDLETAPEAALQRTKR